MGHTLCCVVMAVVIGAVPRAVSGAPGPSAASTQVGAGATLADDATLVRRLADRVCDDLPELAGFRECLRRAESGEHRKLEEAANELVVFFDSRWRPAEPPTMPPERSRKAMIDAMQHRFKYGSIVHQFGDRIDWDLPLDYEWRVSLNRLGFLSSMAMVARYDRDERAATELQDLLRSWIQDCPLPPRRSARYESWQKWPIEQGINWRSLDAAIRVRGLRFVYGAICDLPGITRNTRLQIIHSIWEHIDYLKDDDWDRANWLSLVINAVSTAGIEWTMFRDALRWRDAARIQLENNVLRDIRPDGKEIEDSTGYIQFALNHLIQSYLRLKDAGVAFPPEVDQRLRGSIDFSAWVAFPNGRLPMIGDSDDGEPYVPARFWQVLGRPDVGYLVTAGEGGTPPREASRGWSDGGWYVMRSPWGTRPFAQDLHMVIKTSPGGPHGHLDQLTVTAYAYGQPLLIDPGRLNYRQEGAREFACTPAHNTIVVDGRSQARGAAAVAKWVVAPSHDFLDTSHRLYNGVTHRRRVLYVKDACWLVVDSLTGKDEHLYEQRWHFPEQVEIHREGERVIAESRQGPGIAMIPLDTGQLLEGRAFDYSIAYEWDQKTASRGWQWAHHGGHLVFATLLVPYPEQAKLKAKVLATRIDEDAIDCTVNVGEQTWTIRLGPEQIVECRLIPSP